MTDQHEPDHPRSVDDDVDPAALAWVEQALRDLAFLRPEPDPAGADAAEPDPVSMPPEVWQRLQQALAAEPAVSPPATPAIPTPAPATPAADALGATDGPSAEPEVAEVVPMRRQPSRAARWAGGLVAASVAVVAVGFGVTTFQGGGGGAVVAGDAPAPNTAAEALTAAPEAKAGAASADPSALALAAPSTDPSTPTAESGTSYLDGPETMTFAGMAPPVLRLVQSDTAYTEDGLRGQVSDVLDEIGLSEPEAVVEAVTDPEPEVEVPAEAMGGFAATESALRDCITKLTSETSSTALMVDMATFEGREAGVVVAPEYPMSSPEPSAPMTTTLEVWVVDPECDVTMKIRLRSVSTP